jgi:DNA-binding winged helix-turn-helix (wHTH) protein/tetratricopeptide (TPR) repeat protein
MQKIAFGDFLFDCGQRTLTRRGEPIALGLRATLLLEALLQRQGQVVRKADLIGAAWGDQVVEESNLSVQIAALRRCLGKDDAGRDWIATIERVGYRFLAAPPRTSRKGYLSLPILEVGFVVEELGRPSIVAEAETDRLIAVLSRFSSFITCRSEELRTVPDYRLVCVVEANGDDVRVRLTEASTGRTLWAEITGRRQSDNGVAPNYRIAANVEARVQTAEIRRSLNERAESDAPYDLYLRTRALLRTSRHDDNARAMTLILKALESEPDNALLLGAAGETLHTRKLQGWPGLTGDDQTLRLGLARRTWEASEYDADSLALAGNTMFSSGEPELGLTLTDLAAEMNPASPSVLDCAGHSHLWIGELEDARPYYERVIALAPNELVARFAYASLACFQHLNGEPEQALATARRGLAVSPTYSGIHWHMMVANLQLNREADARRGLAAYRDVHPHARLDSIRAAQPFRSEHRLSPLVDSLRELGMPAN